MNDVNKIFDLYHWGNTKSYGEILADNEYCGVIRERLQCLCLERGYSFKFLNDNFGLAYQVCGLLHLSLFREFFFVGTLTIYKNLEEYCFKRFSPSDDDIIILRSLIVLFLSKNIEPLDGSEETIDYILDCIAKQDRKFAKKVFGLSKKDNQKHRFNFEIVTSGLNSWENQAFDLLFHSSLPVKKESLDRIYKHVVCLWPLEERWKVVYAIDGYFTYSSSFWKQHKGTEWEDDLRVEIAVGMKYLKNLAKKDMDKGYEMVGTKDSIRNDTGNLEIVDSDVSKHQNLLRGNVKSRSKGRTPEPLFKNAEGEKDDELTKNNASLFVKYLKEHKASTIRIDAKKDNYVSKAFVVFYRKWKGLEAPNGAAIYRFLVGDCRLKIAVTKRTYMNHIRDMINGFKINSFLDIEANVDTFLNLHNK